MSRILVLTDGRTLGDEDRCRQLAAQAGEKKIPVVALGLGEDWNQDLLLEMAKYSQGKADYVATPETISEAFSEEVKELQTVAVHGIHILARMTSGVSLIRAYKVVPRIEELNFSTLSDSDVSLLAGELGQDRGQSLLLEIAIPPSSPPRRQLCRLEITYDLPEEGLFGQKMTSELSVAISYSRGDYCQEVLAILQRVAVSRLTARAIRDAETGRIPEATQKLRDAATRLVGLGETSLAETALMAARSLEAGLAPSAGNTMSLVFGTKKLTSSVTALGLDTTDLRSNRG